MFCIHKPNCNGLMSVSNFHVGWANMKHVFKNKQLLEGSYWFQSYGINPSNTQNNDMYILT